MVGHFGRSVLVRIHIRAVFFLVTQCLHYTEELFVSTQKAIRYTVNIIRYVTLQFTEPRGADSLRQSNRVEITVLMCGQNPCPVWFSCRRKSYAVYCKHCLSLSISVCYVLFVSKYERGYSKRFMKITTESWRNLHTSVYLFDSSCP